MITHRYPVLLRFAGPSALVPGVAAVFEPRIAVVPAQFLYQAQQLIRLDLSNVPQFVHFPTGATSGVMMGVLAICHRTSHR